MKIKIIKNEEEYQQALDYLEGLMDAAPGSPEEEQLELISLLIENYEQEYYPIDLPDPIEAIKFRMDQQGLSQKDMQKYIGSQSKVSEVLNYKRPLSLSMIRSLNEGLGIPAGVLLHEPGKIIGNQQYHWKDFPFTEMFRRGYFRNFSGNLHNAKDYAEELLSEFFSIFNNHMPNQVYCRYSDKEMSSNALRAWHAMALHLVSQESLPEFSRETLSEHFFREIISLSYFSNGPQLAKELLNKKGIHFLVLERLQKTYLDGACFKAPDGTPVIGMTLRHDRLDNFWFTLAHELAHLYLHQNDENLAYFDDTDDVRNMDNGTQEPEADNFALEILIPASTWNTIAEELLYAPDAQIVQEIADQLSISPAILAGRIRWETGNYSILNDLIGQGQVRYQLIAN